MASNMTITSSDGRVDVVHAPEGLQAESGNNNQGFQRNGGHADEVEDIVSIGVALSTAEKLRDAKDEVELMKALGIDEEKARELVGIHYQELPGEKMGKEDYLFDAVREVVIDMLSGKVDNDDEVVVFRAFEARLADKIREKEVDPINRENKTLSVDGQDQSE